MGMSGMSGLHGMSGIIGGSIYDSMPSVTGSMLWLSSGKNVYSDDAGTTPTAIDGTMAHWNPVNAAWGLGTYSFRQTVAGDRPTLKSNGVQSASNDYMTLNSGTISLTGDFTVWVVYYLASFTRNMVSLAKSGAGSYFDSFQCNNSGNGAYAMADSTYSQWVELKNGTANAVRIHRFRRSGTDTYHRVYGQAEILPDSLGLSNNTITLNAILQRGGTNLVNTASQNRLLEIVVASASYNDASAENIAVIAKLQALVPTAQW